MEEEKKENGKWSYEELEADFNQLRSDYKALVVRYQNAMHEKEFEYMSFFLQMLFKVIEHKPAYEPEFGKWAADNIMNILTIFGNSLSGGQCDGEPKKESGNESK